MVKIDVVLNDTSYTLLFRKYEKSISINMFDFFSGLDFFGDGVSLITPEWFNDFHENFFREMKLKLNFWEKMKLKVFGTTIKVTLENDVLLDDLILRTLSGLFEHLIRARIIHFIFNGKKIDSLKYLYSIELLVERYAKTKKENLRIRSKLYDVDKYYNQ